VRFALWGAGLIALAAIPAFAGYAGVVWELAQVAGLASALACIALCGSPIRPRDSRPPTLLSLQLHTLLGWVALIAAVLHIAGLVIADRTVVEYLKTTAPLYQIAGISAGVLLLILVLSSIAGARQRLWRSHRGFQAAHVILACLLAALIAVHAVVTARYVGGRGRRILFVAVTLGALLMLLRARRPSDAAAGTPGAHKQLVFGRHSRAIVGVVAIVSAAIAGLYPQAAGTRLREPLLRRASALPLDFPHGKHGMVNCLTCHHNYADGRGGETCIPCHRSSRADLKAGAEARLHGFCFDCHRHPEAAFERHGPVSGCVICHQPPGTTH